MIKPAFSTVACGAWTLETVAERAAAWGYPAVELRTFGEGSRQFTCDPALTGPEKILRLFSAVGVQPCMLATSVAFDAPIKPPVLGRVLSDTEVAVRAAKRAIDLAASIECPLIRVFAFELPAREKRAAGVRRIVDRLRMVVDHADRTGVRIAIENGGSFSRAADLAEILDEIPSPLLGACYAVSPAHHAGEPPHHGLNILGARTFAVRLQDDKAGRPAALGSGDVPCADAVAFLARSNFTGPVIYQWDHAWVPGLEPAERVLPAAIKCIMHWAAPVAPSPGARAATQHAGV